MFTKLICIAALAISCVCAKPGVVTPFAYSAPLVATSGPAFATAQSSQVIARNYNGIAPLAYTATVAAPLAYTAAAAAPYATAYAAPYASPYAAPYAATYAASYAAPYAAPFASPYAAYPYNQYVL